jgi:hypothetical protein
MSQLRQTTIDITLPNTYIHQSFWLRKTQIVSRGMRATASLSIEGINACRRGYYCGNSQTHL